MNVGLVRNEDLLSLMPKVDLHLHLDGSLQPETVIDIARMESIELPTTDPANLVSYMRVAEECRDLRDYLSKFDFTTRFLQTPEALERAAYEVIQQSAPHHCKYVEVRFAPQLHRKNGLSVEEVIHYVTQGLKRGSGDSVLRQGGS
ncbi:hypothetical protein L0M14_24475 [Paenibacillus hexagrammi]|uniref:adenosine deaminase n=1 Tax=Paenibacillus hexagrammi TaxID=2908839 RepID=A0ABY3SSC5_9BACL|nr:hypothetical protein [Paenibacillus sp. YPD9-1]UJF36470.1 hypothetical protein L0M14_24475 [Paenibacillus sp. YPD9-1]